MRIKVIYDNGGRFVDRYTVVFEPVSDMALGLSDNCDSPQGFSNFGQVTEGPHLGRIISPFDLPKNVYDHLKSRIK